MFQRKLIAVFGVVALLAVSAGLSQASLSRVEGMGLGNPALSQFTDDYANIFFFPTSVVRQNNLVLAEVGNNPGGAVDPVAFDNQSLTIIKNFPKFGSIAYQMKQNALNSQFSNNLTHEQIDLIYGRALSKLDLAIRFDMTNSSFELDNSAGVHQEMHGNGILPGDPYPFEPIFAPNAIAGTGTDINTMGITPSVAFHMKNDNRIEAALTFRTYTLDRNISTGGVAGEEWKDQGNPSYGIAARAFLHDGDRATWVPAFWYVNDDLSYEINNLPIVAGSPVHVAADESYKNIGLGISHNMRVNDNNLLIFGVAGWQQKSSFERTDGNLDNGGAPIVSADIKKDDFTLTMFPLFLLSLETDATSWLTIRMGATKAMFNTKEEQNDFAALNTTTKEKTSDFQFNLGTGIKFHNLDIDMTLNQAFPLSGGWIMSGDPATPFTRVSGTYHF